MTRRPAALLALTALTLLAGCGGRGVLSQQPTPPCPRVAWLADAVDLVRYRPGAVPDVATVEVEARMTDLQVRCTYAPHGAGLDVTVVVLARVERGPAAPGRTVELPYVIGVTEGPEDRLLNRGADTLRVTFPGNERRVEARGEEMMVRLPGDVRRAAETTVLVGFRLTPEEYAANQRRGTR